MTRLLTTGPPSDRVDCVIDLKPDEGAPVDGPTSPGITDPGATEPTGTTPSETEPTETATPPENYAWVDDDGRPVHRTTGRL